MTTALTAPARRLAAALDDLRARVRTALAGEVGKAAADAVREAVTAVLGGGDPSPGRHAYRPDPYDDRPSWSDPDDDPWADRTYRTSHNPYDFDDESDPRPAAHHVAAVTPTPTVPTAVAAGLTAGRWWLRRRGSIAEAAAVGVLAGLAVLAGGPLARLGVDVAASAADLVAVTDVLACGAARLSTV